MQYTVKKLDGRYAHKQYFEYCADFGRQQFGPINFHTTMAWMIETYGYSAEVRDFMWIRSMLRKRQQFNVPDSDNFDFNGNLFANTDLNYYDTNEDIIFLKGGCH